MVGGAGTGDRSARYQETTVGCVGLRFGPSGFAELTRMYVAPTARGQGGGAVLLGEAERQAGLADARTVRLETRLDLTAARTLYTKHGYREVPAYTHGPYAECRYAKDLR
ncbi:MAG TPA: GNAT family N-acetyltransferase [Pseudonocardiaceae bacterium]